MSKPVSDFNFGIVYPTLGSDFCDLLKRTDQRWHPRDRLSFPRHPNAAHNEQGKAQITPNRNPLLPISTLHHYLFLSAFATLQLTVQRGLELLAPVDPVLKGRMSNVLLALSPHHRGYYNR